VTFNLVTIIVHTNSLWQVSLAVFVPQSR